MKRSMAAFTGADGGADPANHDEAANTTGLGNERVPTPDPLLTQPEVLT